MPKRLDDGGDHGGVGTLPPDAQLPGPPPEDDETWGVRCTACSIEWPLIPLLFGWPNGPTEELNRFADAARDGRLRCPVCLDHTAIASNFVPIDLQEAWSLKNQADFRRYYERTRGVLA